MKGPPVEKAAVVVGTKLPFSIYGADGTLLLAQGEFVKSESIRRALLSGGAYWRKRADGGGNAGGLDGHGAADADEQENARSGLERYAREYSELVTRWRPTLLMSHFEASENFTTAILGVHDRNNFILAAPRRADRSLVAVLEGQTWTFRTLYYTTALRFQASIRRVAFEPSPHLHVELPQMIERRTVRKSARVPVALHATIQHTQSSPAVIIDLSVGGMRFAIDGQYELVPGQAVVCLTTLTIHERTYPLEINATVLARDPTAPEHPSVAIYRAQFASLNDLPLLSLQAYLGTALAEELDSFWRVIGDPARSDVARKS